MGADDPAGLELLRENLGHDLTELKHTCTTVLSSGRLSCSQLVWNPNASDSELIACLKDIIDAMATVAGNTLTWTPHASKTCNDDSRRSRHSSSARRSSYNKGTPLKMEAAALHIVCNCDEAMTDARVLQVVVSGTVYPRNASFPLFLRTLNLHPVTTRRPRWQ